MSITARCATCQKVYKVDDQWAGKKVRCKNCGEVISIPKVVAGVPLDAGVAAPRPAALPGPVAGAPGVKSPAKAPPRTAPPPVDATVEDPFGNLDSLMALEQTGTIQDAPPIPRGRGRAVPAARTTPDEDHATDDKVGPVVQRKTSVRKTGPQPVRYADRTDQTFSMPGEELIDKFLPIASIGITIMAALYPLFAMISMLMSLPPEVTIRWGAVFKGFAYYLGGLVVAAVILFGIFVPLCMAGVNVASALMKFARPENLYRRCATVVCAPNALSFLLFWISINRGEPLMIPPWMLLVLNALVVLTVLLLMMRLKPLPFAVTAAFVFLFVVVIPAVVVFLLMLALATRLTFLNLRTSPFSPGRNTPPPAVRNEGRTTSNAFLEGKESGDRIRGLSREMLEYCRRNGAYPSRLQELADAGMSREYLTDGRGRPWAYVLEAPPSMQYSFGSVPGLPRAVPRGQFIIAHSVMPVDGGRCVLYADWSEAMIPEATFARQIAMTLGERGGLLRKR